MTASTTSSRWNALLTALGEFERTPGRYPLALREPRLLFDEAHVLLLLAAGRHVEDMTFAALEESTARRAARFFVRTALLRQGNDHYTLLGLTPTATGEQVREHYRLMIRLTHPDFEAGGEHWPTDAASRINIANDVLSSAVRRREYDESLQPATPQTAPAPGPVTAPAAAAPAPARRKTAASGSRWSGGLSTRTKAVLAGVGAVLSATALWWVNGSDSGSLTARQRSINEDTASYMESGLGLGKRPPPPSARPAPTPPALVTAAANPAPALPVVQKSAPPIADRSNPPVPAVATANAVVTPAKTPVADSEPSSGMSLQIARQLTLVKPEPVAATSTEIVQAPAPTPAPAPQRLSLQQVHPLMTNVLSSLSGGRGENLAQWIAPEWRNRPANQAFVTQFNQWLGGQRVKEVSKVSLSSQPQGDNLVVDGVVQLTTQQTASGEQARSLRLRALFQPQDGQAVLTQLTASEPQ